MTECDLIKLTQYAFSVLKKSLPKGHILMSGFHNTVEFYDNSNGILSQNNKNPVGFYFKTNHKFELRSKYDGHELISFKGEDLNRIMNILKIT